MKIAIVVGTRPEIIKLAPIIKEYEKRGLPFTLIHSNQHYSANMDKVFFKNLHLPYPKFNLNVGPGTHAQQTAKILERIEKILLEEKIDLVYVQGDTNTVLAGGLAATKLRIKVAHVEAGLRSYDLEMPEEINRIAVDHFADYLFAVTEVQKRILEKEGIPKQKIHVVGNTIVDSLNNCVDMINSGKIEVIRPEVNPKEYFLITAHRPTNVDYETPLKELISSLDEIAREFNKICLWPIHPRSKSNIEKFNLTLPSSIKIMEPVGYFDFVNLMQNTAALLTDSGGIQEEACILKIPCLTLRENTERPESVEAGSNIICGRDADRMKKALNHFLNRDCNWENPFGDGKTASRIVEIVHGSCVNDF